MKKYYNTINYLLRFLEYKEKTEEATEEYNAYSSDFETLVIRSKSNTKNSVEVIEDCVELNDVLLLLSTKKEKKVLENFVVPSSEIDLKVMNVSGSTKLNIEKVVL